MRRTLLAHELLICRETESAVRIILPLNSNLDDRALTVPTVYYSSNRIMEMLAINTSAVFQQQWVMRRRVHLIGDDEFLT